jgi:hypothetical protein
LPAAKARATNASAQRFISNRGQRQQFLVGVRGWLMRWMASKFFSASTLGNGCARVTSATFLGELGALSIRHADTVRPAMPITATPTPAGHQHAPGPLAARCSDASPVPVRAVKFDGTGASGTGQPFSQQRPPAITPREVPAGHNPARRPR